MQPRPDPRCWIIIADLKHAARRLHPVSAALPRHKRAGQRRIEEIDRSGVGRAASVSKPRPFRAVSSCVLSRVCPGAVPQVALGDLYVAVFGQLAPAQLPFGNALEPGPLQVAGFDASLRGGTFRQ
jgi:hypothetical protein